MTTHFKNAAYGALDYAAHPLGMLLVAPIILKKLGVAEYGIWTIATAGISVGGIVASGFCDANIQRIASLRSTGNTQKMISTVRSMLAINIAAGAMLAALAWIAAPYAVPHIVVARPELATECLVALRIAAVVILVRALESVAGSTQRGFEAYRGTIQINTVVRLGTLFAAAVLAMLGQRSASILMATAIFLAVGTVLQLLRLPRFLKGISLVPSFQREEGRLLLRTGIFSWIQALGGIVLGQLDRLLLGVSLGAVAVAPYALCVQFAQPLSGLTASTLQFLFPHISKRAAHDHPSTIRRTLLMAFLFNCLIVAGETVVILVAGRSLIRIWTGPAMAEAVRPIFPIIVLGSALMGVSVTANYALLALKMFRAVTAISLTSRTVTLLLMVYLAHHGGLKGMAISRLIYGLLSLLLYVPLARKLGITDSASPSRTRLHVHNQFAEEQRP
jgi:O-antigen/teichoic acid export membrane protein